MPILLVGAFGKLNLRRHNEALDRLNRAFALRAGGVGLADKGRSNTDVLEHVTETAELILVNREVADVHGALEGLNTRKALAKLLIILAGVKHLAVIGNQIDIPLFHQGFRTEGFP